MTNLIGDDILSYEQWLTVPGATVHLYGKRAAGLQDGPCHRSVPQARNSALAERDRRSGPLQAFTTPAGSSLSQR